MRIKFSVLGMAAALAGCASTNIGAPIAQRSNPQSIAPVEWR
jgi:hypothetical protein